MREVIRAPHSGFCFGVKRAIDLAKTTQQNLEVEGKRGLLYTCGPLIHNKRVTDELKALGVGETGALAALPKGSTVVVRSHGEPPLFYEEAAKEGINLVDATCPFVTKIHKLVKEAFQQGKQVILVGSSDHPEVTATVGWTEDTARVVSGGAEMKNLLISMKGEGKEAILKEKGVLLAAQTTIKEESFLEALQVLQASGIPTEFVNTICNATKERQEGCRETAKCVDFMVVIGDQNSSNSRKLYEIASQCCKNACFIENFKDLSLQDLGKFSRIGVAAGASTPDNAIKEVISYMSEKTLEQATSMEELMEFVDKGLRLPRSGELVTGTVHQVTDKEVIVNLGCKKDGVIPLSEANLSEEQATLADAFNEGEEIQAKVLKTDDGDGSILLSRKKLEVGEHWKEINQALEDKAVIEVDVVRQVNGGVIAAYKEVSGFIPLSQLSDRYVEDSSEFVGQTLPVKVSRVDPRRNKAVFSHKQFLNEERQKAMQEIWEKIHVGDIVEGTVMRFTDYGAFVDIGGIDGLLHISEISWGKLKHPQEVLEVGQKISVKVLSMNAEKGKISLGLKQTVPEPWSIIDNNYNIGDVVEGKVVQIKEYGCFVELEPGLDGLVHISEVSHRRIANISDELSVGDKVKTKILEIDRERKRISLSIKDTVDPEEEAASAMETEETPAEDAFIEEPVADEAPAEEAAEAPAEEAAEAPAEEAEEAPAEEAAEAPAEEAEEAPAEEAEEAPAEEAAEAPSEEDK